ncbi:MAG: hypothetical protein ACI4K7_06520 [Oscillospiraceae bacterium]
MLSEDIFSREDENGETEYVLSVSFADTSAEDGYRIDVDMDACTGDILRFNQHFPNLTDVHLWAGNRRSYI